MKETDRAACELILTIGKRMYAKNMVVSNDGNISCRVADGIWATPTRRLQRRYDAGDAGQGGR